MSKTRVRSHRGKAEDSAPTDDAADGKDTRIWFAFTAHRNKRNCLDHRLRKLLPAGELGDRLMADACAGKPVSISFPSFGARQLATRNLSALGRLEPCDPPPVRSKTA